MINQHVYAIGLRMLVPGRETWQSMNEASHVTPVGAKKELTHHRGRNHRLITVLETPQLSDGSKRLRQRTPAI